MLLPPKNDVCIVIQNYYFIQQTFIGWADFVSKHTNDFEFEAFYDNISGKIVDINTATIVGCQSTKLSAKKTQVFPLGLAKNLLAPCQIYIYYPM